MKTETLFPEGYHLRVGRTEVKVYKGQDKLCSFSKRGHGDAHAAAKAFMEGLMLAQRMSDWFLYGRGE